MRRVLALAGCLLLLSGLAHAAGPFGVVTPDSGGGVFGGPLAPFFLWVASYQAAFYKALSATIQDLRANPWGAWFLIALSFAYGVFHAVGPGHGKAVITSYLLSSGENVRRGVAISFAAAIVQAFSAIAIVFAGAIVLRLTAPALTRATDWMEIASYAAIAAAGAWLLWVKSIGGGHHHHHHHALPGEAPPEVHDHDHDDHHDQHHHHGHDDAGTLWGAIARAWSAILAVGVRPCSGAIIVLVFSLSQGLIVAGVAATLVMALGTGLTVAILAAVAVSAKGLAVRLAGSDTPAVARAVRGFEIAAAACVLLFGLILLGGALANGLP